MDPLFNDLDTAIDFDQEDDNDQEDDMLEALSRKLAVGGGVYNTNNLNTYAYGYNNPVSFDDPDGRCPWCLVAVFLLASEPAMAPTHDRRDGQRMADAKNDKALTLVTGSLGLGAAKPIYNVVKDNLNSKKEKIHEIVIDGKKYPESAKKLKEAINEGKKNVGVVDRVGAAARRKENLKDVKKEKGKDRDEAPPAVINTGEKTKIKTISPSDNRGAGSSIRHQLKNVKDGEKVKIVPINLPKE